MCTFKDNTGMDNHTPSDEYVIKTQVISLVDIMVGQVQDRVCNEQGVLSSPAVGLGDRLKEQQVWGIDCYCRRMIELAVEDHEVGKCSTYGDELDNNDEQISPEMEIDKLIDDDHNDDDDDDRNDETRIEAEKVLEMKRLKDERTKKTYEEIKDFIEKHLLPAINAQPIERAHNMWYALDAITKNDTSSNRHVYFANVVKSQIELMGIDHFKVHPKGTGILCTDQQGLGPHVVVAHYLGE